MGARVTALVTTAPVTYRTSSLMHFHFLKCFNPVIKWILNFKYKCLEKKVLISAHSEIGVVPDPKCARDFKL